MENSYRPELLQYYEEICPKLGSERKIFFVPPLCDRGQILEELRKLGIFLRLVEIDASEFDAYLEAVSKTGLYDKYAKHFGDNFKRKALEHFLSFKLLDIQENDIFMDVAASGSPILEIVKTLYNIKNGWRQDLSYPPGISGNQIGSDASSVPLPDNSISKMTLHCSFEHFESDTDIGFIKECSRLLKPEGMVLIIPLYMSNTYHILSNLELLQKMGLPRFEPKTPIWMNPRPNSVHGRFYDPLALKSRVIDVVKDDLKCKVILFEFNEKNLSIGTNMSLLLYKPDK